MLPKSAVDRIIEVLKKDAKRALKMKVPGFPRPYYCSFLLRDIEWFNTWASSGSVYRRRSDHTRNIYCDIRVGSYRYDQVTEGGLYDNDEELESVAYVTMPIDDNCYDGLRIATWRLSEAKYREALTDYSEKKAAAVSMINPHKRFASFSKSKPVRSVDYAKRDRIDEQRWVRYCKNASSWLSELESVTGSWVEFDASQETKIFHSTDGSTIVQHFKIYSLSAHMRYLSKEGSYLEQELVIHRRYARELPTLKELKQMLMEKYAKLVILKSAKRIHAFSGPVLLYPKPSGLLFHEAIGHRLEGSRLLSSGEGQTFKGQVGKRILNVDLSIVDNPKMKKYKGRSCIGSYDFDDEGVPAEEALLVEHGILKGFLNTKASVTTKGHKSNGHARNKKFQRPISRMAITIVEAKDSLSMDALRQKLVDEINRQGKPFGMIVYETSGGETDTTSYDFQAFFGEISFASLVYPDGHEVCVRGVNFVGTPLQALNNIIAVGKEKEVDNAYCGAESGFIPVTTISPAVLIKNLELQAKDEALVTQYILPRPVL